MLFCNFIYIIWYIASKNCVEAPKEWEYKNQSKEHVETTLKIQWICQTKDKKKKLVSNKEKCEILLWMYDQTITMIVEHFKRTKIVWGLKLYYIYNN